MRKYGILKEQRVTLARIRLSDIPKIQKGFQLGAKWQAERTYSEDEVRELLIKALTHNDYNLCGSLATRDWEIRTANFNVWFEENKKK